MGLCSFLTVVTMGSSSPSSEWVTPSKSSCFQKYIYLNLYTSLWYVCAYLYKQSKLSKVRDNNILTSMCMLYNAEFCHYVWGVYLNLFPLHTENDVGSKRLLNRNDFARRIAYLN